MGESGEDQWPEQTGPKFTSQIFVGAEVIQKANDTYDDVKKEENQPENVETQSLNESQNYQEAVKIE